MKQRSTPARDGRAGRAGKRYTATANTFARTGAVYDSLDADAWLPAQIAGGILAAEEADPHTPPVPFDWDDPFGQG